MKNWIEKSQHEQCKLWNIKKWKFYIGQYILCVLYLLLSVTPSCRKDKCQYEKESYIIHYIDTKKTIPLNAFFKEQSLDK